MNNFEGLTQPLPPICELGRVNTEKVFYCFIEKHYAQRKVKQKSALIKKSRSYLQPLE